MVQEQNINESKPSEILGQIEAFTEEMLHTLTAINKRVKILAEKINTEDSNKQTKPKISDSTTTSSPMPAAKPVLNQNSAQSSANPIKQSTGVEKVVNETPDTTKQPISSSTNLDSNPKKTGGDANQINVKASQPTVSGQGPKTNQPAAGPNNPNQQQNSTQTPQAPSAPQGNSGGKTQVFQP